MDDLIAFLRDRLREDAAVARAAGGRTEGAWEADLSGKDPLGQESWPVVVRYTTGGRLRGAVAHLPVTAERSENRMTHIARHDPARVLRGVEAKWEIVGRYAWLREHGDTGDAAWVLPLLAAPYSDHPDYREEWRP